MSHSFCGIYARFSSGKQSPLSLADQIRTCQAYAERQGWEVLNEHIYTDGAMSGTSADDRPGLERLICASLSPAHPFDTILVDDTSRLARNLADVIRLCERLKFAGVRVVSVSQHIDTSDEQSDV